MREIALSVVSAIEYGIFCNLFLLFSRVIFGQFVIFANIIKESFFWKGRLFAVNNDVFSINKQEADSRYLLGPKIISKMLLFTLGFYLVSYVFLDGEIRLYMLCISIATLFSTRRFILKISLGVFDRIFKYVYCTFTILLRILFLPAKVFSRFLSKKIPLFRKMV